jgi:hypothetical protein
MADTAAHLVDRVLPEVPVRQWVLSLPFALRYRPPSRAALERRGLGPNADPMEADPLAREEPVLAALAAASLEGRVATGPRAGQRLLRLCYRLKRRWRDGTTHLLLERVALLELLAALVPPPRFHLVRYHGIFAPCASWRDHVVPVHAGPLIPQTSRTARTSKGPADTRPGGDGARSGPSLRGDPGTTAASGG